MAGLVLTLPACFNVTTGDVEDAPALNALAKYPVVEKDGGVFITADEDQLKTNFPNTLSLKCQAQGTEKIVVVGGKVLPLLNCQG
jgi:hypothetical protein